MKDPASSKKTVDSFSLSKGIIALIALVGILLVVQFSLSGNGKRLVKGVKTEKATTFENEKASKAKERLQGTLEQQLEDIKRQVTQLDPQDFVKSSSQVQKIIDDLKDLQGVPRDELKNVCENICKSL